MMVHDDDDDDDDNDDHVPCCGVSVCLRRNPPRHLAGKYINDHAVREADVLPKSRGSGSHKRWLPSAMLRVAPLASEWRFGLSFHGLV